MTPPGVGARLMDTYLAEMAEHVLSANRELAALERGVPGIDDGERFDNLCRTTHSLKGASQAVRVFLVETACHLFEEVLPAARNAVGIDRPARFALLYETVDALADAHARLKAGQPLTGSALEKLVPRLDEAAHVALEPAALPVGAPVEEVPQAQAPPEVVQATLDHVDPDPGRGPEANRIAEAPPEAVQTPRAISAPITPRPGADQNPAPETIPFEDACEGIDKLVQDLAAATSKRIRLEIVGATVQMERALAATLQDPLRHLVRNAADHGIEPPAERQRARKPLPARIVTSLVMDGPDAVVSVMDDGRGLDLEALRAAARRIGIPEPASSQDLVRVLCHPGLSTAARISALSGRGAGLDAVRSRVEGLGGSLAISFTPGLGTRFELRIPRPGHREMLVWASAAGVTYGIPAESVERVITVTPEELRWLGTRAYVAVAGRPIPIAPIDVLVTSAPARVPAPSARRAALVLTSGAASAAIAVESIGGIHDATVDRATPLPGAHAHLIGATVTEAGHTAFVLRPADIVAQARHAPWLEQPAPVADSAHAGSRAENSHVVLACEGPWARELLRRVLAEAGYRVSPCGDADEARRALANRPADVVVAEISTLPGAALDGASVVRSARGLGRGRPVAALLLTHSENPEAREENGATTIDISVPLAALTPRELLETVAELLDRRDRARR